MVDELTRHLLLESLVMDGLTAPSSGRIKPMQTPLPKAENVMAGLDPAISG
jgi:hypothetical protein